ncbi:MAG: hypothetical protein CL583_13430 [Alteromonadaceae bacterium]|nr:hypothetical protein [Alteromonadaceae bacterium]|tara:strand:- start:143 stop:478 length:336 start_codon:yes stop_codon:yes gene_type:complete
MSDKDFDRIIGARLKEARISAGYETAQAAADARPKVHVQSVRDQEAGRRGVSPEQLLLYSKKYAVSIQWLLTGEGPMTSIEGLVDDVTLKMLTPEKKREVADFARFVAARK